MVFWTGTGEAQLSMRTKFNNFLAYFLEPGHRAKNVALLVASTAFTYSAGSLKTVAAGDIITTKHGGFAYEVQAVGASTYDLATAGGVLLNLLPSDDGAYNFRGMNPAANGSTDDYPLLAKVLGKALTPDTPLEIKFPTGNYFMGSTIDLRRSVKLVGDGGYTSTICARLTFAANTTGICINRFNTNVNGLIASTTESDGSGIHGLRIFSAGGTDRTKHGIVIRARGLVFNTSVSDFPGDGIHVQAGAGLGGYLEGNANQWVLMNVNTTRNKNHGLYVNGDDANSGTAINVDAASNGRYGIWDSSFLGNTYIGCHVATNGVALVNGNSSIQSSYVTFDNNRYAAHWNATEAQLVATQPGTNPNVWILDAVGFGEHPTVPLWTAGRPEGTYFVAFGYRADNDNNACVFLGCYSEGGASGNVFQGRCLVLGGQLGAQYAGDRLGAGLGGVPGSKAYSTSNNGLSTNLTDGTGYMTWRGLTNELQETWRFKRTASGGITFNNADLGARTVYNITGLSDSVPWKFSVSDFLHNGVREGVRSAAPTTEFWPTGSYLRNSNVASGQPRGWRCTAGGTPGTWVADSNWP